MSNVSSKFRNLSFAQAVLFGLILAACTVDFGRRLPLGVVSGLGALTLGSGAAVWAAWLLRPVLPARLLVVFLPLMLFGVDAAGTLMWYSPGMDGVQLLVVALTFLGTMMLTARETAIDPELADQLRTVLILTSAFPILIWLGVLGAKMVPAEDTNITRPFALYVLVIMAVTLAIWRSYVWPEPVRGNPHPLRYVTGWRAQWPLAWVGITAFTVLLGMSRTSLIVIVLMVPLSLIYRGSKKSVFRGCMMLVLGSGVIAATLYSYQPLYDRFFKEDASLTVAGVSINGTGRAEIWNLLLTTIGDDWMFGKGISSSEAVVAKVMPNVGQPHNDYLRFYYDQGVLGVILWACFIFAIARRLIENLRRSIRRQTPDYSQHLGALLAFTGVSFSMLTDNSYCYPFVMTPLAVVLGSSLGVGRYYADRDLATAGTVDQISMRALSYE